MRQPKTTVNKTLAELEDNRLKYRNIVWKSKNGIETAISNMEDDHLIHVLRNVGSKLFIAERFPLVTEFQTYNNIPYSVYADALYNEYKYRIIKQEQEAREVQDYNDYLNSHSTSDWDEIPF